MSTEPNETWVTQKNTLDPFFETRDHANKWDARGLWAEPLREDKLPKSSAEKSDA